MIIKDVRFGDNKSLDGIIAYENGKDIKESIIFLHGFLADCRGDENKARVKIYCEKAPEYGLNGLTFSFRGHGRSKGKSGVINKRQLVDDIKAAVGFVKEEFGEGRVYLCGSSTGATGALYFVAEEGGIEKLVLISPYTSFDNINLSEEQRKALENYYEIYKKTQVEVYIPFLRTDKPEEALKKQFPISSYYWLKQMNGIEIAKRIHIPCLVISGINDKWINPKSIRELYLNLKSERKEFREYYDDHGLKDHEQEVIEDIFSWFKK